MKNYPIYTLLFLVGLISLGSCSDDSFDKTGNVKEGVPTTLTLSLSASEVQQITTKSALNTDDFNAVYDIYVFVYDKDNQLEAKEDFQYQTAVKNGTVTFSEGAVASGVKHIYAIANASKNGLLETLNHISTGSNLSELEALTFTLKDQTVQRGEGNLMMSGSYYYDDQPSTGYCEVPAPATEGGGVTLSDGMIKLDHLDSQITFTITSGSDNIDFAPEGWAIYNVPQTSNILEQEYDSDNQNLFSIASASFETTTNKGGSFVFYSMENRKMAKGTPSDVKGRESMNSDAVTYTYAPDDASYVQIKGIYKEYDSDGKLVTFGDVVYTIHLGNFMNDYSNFSNERNKNYTYTLTVNGVNDIIAEVNSDEDEMDGEDGHIYQSDNQYVMDAHYGTALVTFTQDELNSNMIVEINTPYGKDQIYRYDGSSSNLVDYDWVMFVRNQDNSDHFAQYPGEDYTLKNYSIEVPKYSSDATPLMNIKEVFAELKEHQGSNKGNFWKGDQVKYTAFINEFYYKDKADDWRDFVNVDDRTFAIYTSAKSSKDGKSSYSNPSFRISQRSIKTIYNTNTTKAELPSAWGIEAINEDKTQKYFGGSYFFSALRTSGTNGRYNTWYIITGNGTHWDKWSTYVDFKTNELASAKDDARYAFLTRNRDLDGDDVIDDDEIRWYTCATNQYVGMWIGQDALPSETHLIQIDPKLLKGLKTDGTYSCFNFHLLTSNNARFWAEEGTSSGNETAGNRYFFVRCARNLGGYDSGTPLKDQEPVSYVKTSSVTSGDYTYTTIDLSFLNPKAIRKGTFTDNIVQHTEHSGGDLNKPYSSFTINGFITNKKECPAGYRIPNQRELSLIAYYVNNMGSALASCTMSDLTYKKGLYYSLSKQNSIQIMTIDKSSVYSNTRCVKDGGF